MELFEKKELTKEALNQKQQFEEMIKKNGDLIISKIIKKKFKKLREQIKRRKNN